MSFRKSPGLAARRGDQTAGGLDRRVLPGWWALAPWHVSRSGAAAGILYAVILVPGQSEKVA